ncbi:MAG: M14 family metallopeptidase [Bacillota bacterium]
MLDAFDFSHYHRYHELTDFLKQAAEAYPDLARLHSIGRSYEGRDIWVMELSNRQVGDPACKPAMYIEGNMHAGEVTGCAVCQYTIWYLLKNYGTLPEITDLLDTRTFYINPRVSPDGAEKYLTTPYHLRSSVRPYPGITTNGLYQADVDGDGQILQMRVQDPMGGWRVSEHDSRLMVRRRPGEKGGVYYHLYQEGFIRGPYREGEQVKQAAPLWGLDFNRNYPANWAPEYEQRGAGPYPLSEPETRAVVDFLLAHKNVGAIMSYHTSGGVILRPYSTKDDSSFPAADLQLYQALGGIAREITGYDLIGVYSGLNRGRPSHGDLKDWAYEHYGALVFTTELWDIGAAAGAEPMDWTNPRQFSRFNREERMLQLLRWNDEKLGGQAFVDWYPFDHPQLGRVELGGWKTKQYMQNPPPEYLPDECHKNMLFTLRHAALSPLLRIDRVSVTRRNSELWQVLLTVANEGFLPSNITDQAIRAGVARPVEVELDLPPEAEMVDGEPLVDLGHLAGWSKTQATWLLRAAPGTSCTIKIYSERGGCDVQTITLS